MLSIKPTHTDLALSTKAGSNSSIIHTQFPKVKESDIIKIYDKWCKETKRNGSVLVGSSIKEFFEYYKNNNNEK